PSWATNTWVLCLSRRKAVVWMIRSRSRWNSERVRLDGSANSRPRLIHGSAAHGACVAVPNPSLVTSISMPIPSPAATQYANRLVRALTLGHRLHTYRASDLKHVSSGP